jgi:hypothetical protein
MFPIMWKWSNVRKKLRIIYVKICFCQKIWFSRKCLQQFSFSRKFSLFSYLFIDKSLSRKYESNIWFQLPTLSQRIQGISLRITKAAKFCIASRVWSFFKQYSRFLQQANAYLIPANNRFSGLEEERRSLEAERRRLELERQKETLEKEKKQFEELKKKFQMELMMERLILSDFIFRFC